MVLQFGLELDDQMYPDVVTIPEEIQLHCGELGLLSLLEKHFGLSYPEKHEYLRLEQYRQILYAYIQINPKAFFVASFEADSLATSSVLLSRRDELYMAGWDFEEERETPTRLKNIAAIERMVANGTPTSLHAGFAERWRKVEKLLEEQGAPCQKIYLNEAFALLPIHVQKLLGVMELSGVELVEAEAPKPIGNTDLASVQNALLKKGKNKQEVKADGSLVIIKSKRETFAANYLAQVFKRNADYKPLCIIPDKNRALDNALVREGLPSLGILSASLSRPTLQILKLISAFLWKPIDPYKILEFVSLPNRPLHDGLSREIAALMAKKPGLFSGAWNAMVLNFFENFEDKADKADSSIRAEEILKEKEEAQREYNFWFRRNRYDANKVVPKKEVIEIFEYILIWSLNQVDANKTAIEKLDKRIAMNKMQEEPSSIAIIEETEQQKEELQNTQNALLGLYEQARRIVEVLEALPAYEQMLSHLQLERLVRTINEPAPMCFRKAEADHFPFIHRTSAVVQAAEHVLWWNFIEQGHDVGFARWYRPEVEYLKLNNVRLNDTKVENKRLLWQRMQPFLKTRQQLILVMPEYVDGREVLPHPLFGDLQAALGEKNLEKITVNVDSEENIAFLETALKLPNKIKISPKQLGKPKPYLNVLGPGMAAGDAAIDERSRETFTSLEALFYYPYQWVFKYKIGLNKSPILSVIKERTLKGNLAHQAFEKLFIQIKEENRSWTKEDIELWIDENVPPLFEKEGAILLMYGKEPERIGLVNKLKDAAWALVSIIQENNWKIRGIEAPVGGKLAGQDVSGIADLVLERKNGELAVVDLKWGGLTGKRQAIRNKEDLQLVIYSRLVTGGQSWAHAAYFVIENSKMIARNTLAFNEAEAIVPDEDYKEVNREIWSKMETTYAWRMEQLRKGKIEIRTEATCDELDNEEMSLEEITSLLSMRKENARFDNYQVLVNLLQ
ncbi:MAG: PD-(D/E)XK nuclease family protein [Aureispira sp.]|nr:PD-(D/E)XK nuclease family protein [Aureispira sp.]